MIKKINVLIIILIVIILGISLSNNDVNSVSVNKKDYKALIDNNSFIDIYYEIDKTGEDNNFLSGVKFNLRDINNSYIASFTEVDDYYELNEYKNLSFTKAYNFLSDEQKKSVEKIKTTKDLNYYYKKGILKCNFSDGIDNYAANINNVGTLGELPTLNNVCSLMIPTAFILEEEVVPTGYAKEKYLLYGNIRLFFMINIDDFSFTNPNDFDGIQGFLRDVDVNLDGVGITEGLYDESLYIDYGKVNIDSLLNFDFDATYSLWQEKGHYRRCTSSQDAPVNKGLGILGEEKSSGTICPISIQNKKGSASLSIKSFVNNETSINTIKGAKLQYRITIKNDGTADAIDNTVVAPIPEGLTYVTGSASNNGEYSNNQIVWHLDRINASNNIELRYEAIISDTSKVTSFISDATIDSYSVQKKVTSNITVVKVNKSNPKTSNQLFLIELVISLILGLSVTLYLYLKNKHSDRFLFMN